MALDLIGAGFGRTGTESMKKALETLGLGRCHHMVEVLPDERQKAIWTEVASAGAHDWGAVFDGFGAAVDWPSAFYWQEIAAAFPEAKVLLTWRPAEDWWRSFEGTILTVLTGMEERGETDHFVWRLIGERTFGGRPGDRAHAISVYNANVEKVRASVPPERLHVHELGDGWERLCAFLGRPVPEEPFPRGNAPVQFHETVRRVMGEPDATAE